MRSRAGAATATTSSAPLVRGEPSANGIRVPAADLERLVFDTVATYLRDRAWIAEQLGPGLDAGGTQWLLNAAAKLAASIGEDHCAAAPDLVRQLIARVVVRDRQVVIHLTVLPSQITSLSSMARSPSPTCRGQRWRSASRRGRSAAESR